MGTKLPVLKPKQMVKALLKIGFIKKRQKGSHLILWHPVTKGLVPIPIHDSEIKKGTLKSIIKQAGLTKEDLLKLLKKK